MTYSCAHIVYGIDLTAHDRRSPFTELEEFIEETRDTDLIDGSYNGMGETPYWVGAKLGSINATSSSLKGCRLEPTDEDKAGFVAKRTALLQHLDASDDPHAGKLAALVRAAKPTTFLAWGSS